MTAYGDRILKNGCNGKREGYNTRCWKQDRICRSEIISSNSLSPYGYTEKGGGFKLARLKYLVVNPPP